MSCRQLNTTFWLSRSKPFFPCGEIIIIGLVIDSYRKMTHIWACVVNVSSQASDIKNKLFNLGIFTQIHQAAQH